MSSKASAQPKNYATDSNIQPISLGKKKSESTKDDWARRIGEKSAIIPQSRVIQTAQVSKRSDTKSTNYSAKNTLIEANSEGISNLQKKDEKSTSSQNIMDFRMIDGHWEYSEHL